MPSVDREHENQLNEGLPRDPPPRASRWGRRVRRALLIVVLVIVALLAAGAGLLWSLPSVGDAPARVRSVLAEHHGTAIGVPPPTRLGEAVVAVEDRYFYSNFVINILFGAGRAALATLRTSGDPGGSTITQQLAKQLYGKGSGLAGVLRQIGLAVKLSLSYSKPQILTMYLNAIYFGNGYWGCAAAARGYFHTSPYRLTWAEASMLAGLPQAPSAYDPIEHLELAKERQLEVLNQLVATHVLTPREAEAAYEARLPIS
jgi:membrane carboxypeptidase/penicillin-binding protein PbpC